MTFDLEASAGEVAELRMSFSHQGQPASETWLYQFHPPVVVSSRAMHRRLTDTGIGHRGWLDSGHSVSDLTSTYCTEVLAGGQNG